MTEPHIGFDRHAREQRERWLALTPEQRLAWLERAKRFARVARGAPIMPGPNGSPGLPAAAMATLREIAERWLEVVPRAVENLRIAHPGERFYAAAFWLLYCDYTKILVPALGASSEAHVELHEAADPASSTRWRPAEWNWPVIDAAVDALRPSYERLSASMKQRSRAEWDQIVGAHEQMLARVARELTRRLRGSTPGLAHFVVVVLEDRDGDERRDDLVRASVDASILETLPGILAGARPPVTS